MKTKSARIEYIKMFTLFLVIYASMRTSSDLGYGALRTAANITLQINFDINCQKNNSKMMPGKIIDKILFYCLTIAENVP